MHFPLYAHFISRQMLLKQGMHVHAHIMLCHNAVSSVVSCKCVCSKSLHLLPEQHHPVLQPQRILSGLGRKNQKYSVCWEWQAERRATDGPAGQ